MHCLTSILLLNRLVIFKAHTCAFFVFISIFCFLSVTLVQVIEDMSIQVNVPALAMEEV